MEPVTSARGLAETDSWEGGEAAENQTDLLKHEWHHSRGTSARSVDSVHNPGGTVGNVFLTGVLIDPPATVTFDILGFTNLGPNEFLTTPEPSSFALIAFAGVALIWMARKRLAS